MDKNILKTMLLMLSFSASVAYWPRVSANTKHATTKRTTTQQISINNVHHPR